MLFNFFLTIKILSIVTSNVSSFAFILYQLNVTIYTLIFVIIQFIDSKTYCNKAEKNIKSIIL